MPVAVAVCLAGLDRRRDSLERLLEPPAADRLAQVVERAQLERVDRGAVVGAHEHELGRGGEAPEHPAQLDAVEVGHADVEEDRVVRLARGLEQCVVAAERALDPVHRRAAAQQPRQILERGVLVIDGQDRQPVRAHTDPASWGWATSPRRLGTVISAVVPCPISDSIRSA